MEKEKLEIMLSKLEEIKQSSIKAIADMPIEEAKKDLARKEIDVNELSVRNYLGKMYEDNYNINEDFSHDTLYDSTFLASKRRRLYRIMYDRLEEHLLKVKNIPQELSDGTFIADKSLIY
ncbi:MAG: hypothetical protein WC781_03495 [Candidatus Pacearchaeota archaeon]